MRDWKEANSVFTTIAAVAGRSLTISDRGGEPERYLGAAVSWDLFPLLGTSPILGRGFTAEDDRPGAGRSCCSATICGPGGITATRASSANRSWSTASRTS